MTAYAVPCDEAAQDAAPDAYAPRPDLEHLHRVLGIHGAPVVDDVDHPRPDNSANDRPDRDRKHRVGSICFSGAQRATRTTAVATATKLNRPCQLSDNCDTKSVENRNGLMSISIMVTLPRRFYVCPPLPSRNCPKFADTDPSSRTSIREAWLRL